jgi:hypothetical protein
MTDFNGYDEERLKAAHAVLKALDELADLRQEVKDKFLDLESQVGNLDIVVGEKMRLLDYAICWWVECDHQIAAIVGREVDEELGKSS